MRLTTKTLKKVTLLTALAVPAVFAGQAAALENGEKKEMFSQSQKIGYLGQTSKSKMARSILARMRDQSEVRWCADTTDRVAMWHEILLDSVALDHTPDPDTNEVDFVQGGPTRTSRALAMTQIAVFDALNAFDHEFEPYNNIGGTGRFASKDVAVAFAAYTVLSALYPDQQNRLDLLLSSDLRQISVSNREFRQGRSVGKRAARAILRTRQNDNSGDPEPDFGEGGRVADGTTNVNGNPINGGTLDVFEWEPDPLTPPVSGDFNLSLGAFWGAVTPFSLDSGNQFRTPLPPEPGSQEYNRGFRRVMRQGASVDTDGSRSTPRRRFIGNFWGYDATPLLGTPPRLYNQIAVQVARDEGIDTPVELARYLAMVNTALADSGIAAWDSKYFYNYWRPVTGIRRDDGVNNTGQDPDWKPVGVSVINTQLAITPTPPFPAYPSGHATFGAATFEVMRNFFGDNTRFTFVSDEYNGLGDDPLGAPRPLVPVRFRTLTQAQEQNGISRIFNGVHFTWDNIEGQNQGVRIGAYVFNEEEAFQPVNAD